jgi:hypothetical protein
MSSNSGGEFPLQKEKLIENFHAKTMNQPHIMHVYDVFFLTAQACVIYV